MSSLRHLLAPGTPTYAALKLGALAGVAGLSLAARRRQRRHAPPTADHSRDVVSHDDSPRRPAHPRSRKKRRRRRP